MRVSMTPKPQMPDQVGHDNIELSYPRTRVSIPKTMPYTVTPTHIPDLLVLEPKVFGDARGFFFESFNQQDFNQATGLNVQFVQDNHSRSAQGVLRGLHYQVQQPQGKLVRVVRGAVLDVAVDIRQSSPTFGQWVGVELTPEKCNQLWVPVGFAHGFCTLVPDSIVAYKVTNYYSPENDKGMMWDDPAVGVVWPDVADSATLSAKDKVQPRLADLPPYYGMKD